jgi:hypothetical protein
MDSYLEFVAVLIIATLTRGENGAGRISHSAGKRTSILLGPIRCPPKTAISRTTGATVVSTRLILHQHQVADLATNYDDPGLENITRWNVFALPRSWYPVMPFLVSLCLVVTEKSCGKTAAFN